MNERNTNGICRIVKTDRTVIDAKLLTALEDDNVVAALLTKGDLEVLIMGLDKLKNNRAQEMATGMRQLLDVAFDNGQQNKQGAP